MMFKLPLFLLLIFPQMHFWDCPLEVFSTSNTLTSLEISNNGKQITFVEKDNHGITNLCIARSLAGKWDVKKIKSLVLSNTSAKSANNGKNILYRSENGYLWQATELGGFWSFKKVISNTVNNFYSIDQTGENITYSVKDKKTGNRKVYLARRSGFSYFSFPVTAQQKDCYLSSISASGEKLAFICHNDNTWKLMIAKQFTSVWKKQDIFESSNRIISLKINENGTEIIFLIKTYKTYILKTAELINNQKWIIRTLHPFSEKMTSSPSFDISKNMVIFEDEDNIGIKKIHLMKLKGKKNNITFLSDKLQTESSPIISSKSTYVVYTARDSQQNRLMRIQIKDYDEASIEKTRDRILRSIFFHLVSLSLGL